MMTTWTQRRQWVKAGAVSVDTGTLWLGDPCYVLPADKVDAPGRDWEKFVEGQYEEGPNGEPAPMHDKGHMELPDGVLVSTGVGDGRYDVFVQRTRDGEIAAVKVVFIDEDGDGD